MTKEGGSVATRCIKDTKCNCVSSGPREVMLLVWMFGFRYILCWSYSNATAGI